MKKPKLDASKFCQLHCHSVYSQRDGAITIRDLADTAADKHGQDAVAVSDHGILSSGFVLYQYATQLRPQNNKKPIKPIIGCEMYINDTRQELFDWLPTAHEHKKVERANIRKSLAKYYHGLVIARNQTGYYNLMRIHNESWRNFYHRPMTTPELLFENTEGLIYSTACQAGHIPFHILSGEMDKALYLIDQYKEAFRDWFFLELMPIESEFQKNLNKELIKISKQKNIPLIITNDSHYLEPEDYELHRALINLDRLRKGGKSTTENGKSPDNLWEFGVQDLYLKNLDQMYESWRGFHKGKIFNESMFMSAVETVAYIIDEIEMYNLEAPPRVPKIYDDEWGTIKSLVTEGLQTKVKKGIIPAEGKTIQDYVDRIKLELGVFRDTRTVDYMLICQDMIQWAKGNGIEVGAGRGSAAGSLVSYLLGITDLDPLKWGLFFERFMSVSRVAKMKLELE